MNFWKMLRTLKMGQLWGKKLFWCLLIFFAACSSLCGEEIVDETYGYALDLPEGFEIADFTDDGKNYLFAHKQAGVQFVLKLFDETQNANDALLSSLSKLRSTYDEIVSFSWQGASCRVTQFSLLGQYEGWALAVPLEPQNSCVVLLCYAPSEAAESLQQFMISCVNSLSVGEDGMFEPGPITTYAFPRQKPLPFVLDIDGSKVRSEIDHDDAAAAQFVVDCEWAVLKMYAGHEKWKEAWQRYYKLIFKDSVGRVKKSSDAIYSTLMAKAQKATQKTEAAQGTASTEASENIALMQKLLSWTQDFKYERNLAVSSADFTPVPSCLMGAGNDCDSRAVLLCAIAKNLGIDSMLFVSREYSHALFGLAVAEDTPGAKITVNGKAYLLGETTAKVDLGRVAKEMSEETKWIAVPLE